MTTERDDYYEPAIAKTPTRHVDGRATIQNSELERLREIERAATAARNLLGTLRGVDMHNATVRDSVGAAFVHLDCAIKAVKA